MDISALKRDLAGLQLEDNPAIVRQKSRDFYWYSPVLKDELADVTGDLVVTPRSEAEVLKALGACYAHDVPVTPRGAGTGNYGQAMPLAGGVVLNLAEMNAVKGIAPGRVVTEPGAILAEIDRATRAHSGQELRMSPSTYQTATIGGFIAGGSSGIGSINWGGLRDLGNILRLKVATLEAHPRILEFSAGELQKVSHAYGTNGIIVEVEMPLTASYEWIGVLVAFEDFLAAARYGSELACEDGILTKLVTPVAAPAPYDYFKRHQRFLRRDQSIVAVMVAPHSLEAFEVFTGRRKGEIVFRSDAGDTTGLPPVYELTWNHTTLRALRVDPTITYLQVLYPFPDHLDRVRAMTEMFGDEVPGHLEFVRFDGNITCFGLPLVRFTTRERLEEIMRLHEENGCPIFNPHRYTLEEGGMKQTDAVQLAFKREADPKGLLNPGKMIAWDNPNYDFAPGKVYLFPALKRAG